MNLAPRQEYGLGSLVKSVKKAVSGAAKGVKSFVKSDIGKMALLAAGGFYAGGGSLFGAQRAGMSGFKFGNLPGASFFSGIGKSNVAQQALGGPKYKLGGFGAIGADKGMSGLTKGLIGGGALTALLGAAQAGDQEAITATRDIGALRGYLSSYYENLGYKEEEIPGMVDRDTAEYSSAQGGYANGGRIGAMYGGRMKYAEGSEDMILPMKKPKTEEMISSNPGAAESGNPVTRNEPIANLIEKYNTYKKAMPGVADYTKKYLMEDFKKSLENSDISIEEFMMRLEEDNEMQPMEMAKGGRIGYANGGAGYSFGYKPGKEFQLNVGSMGKGTIKEIINSGELTSEDLKAAMDALKDRKAEGGRIGYAFGSDEIVDQASGIMGIPQRTNKAGVKELDLRDNGGFIPPVGVKEKADDVPAMLSNNEFVFTADAVRGMGNGDVNEGAQRMYDMMKKLENGGRV